MIHEKYYELLEKQEKLLNRKNEKTDFYNGIYSRYKYPVLTREHIPLFWRYDLDCTSNPNFQERLGINAVFNSGAIEFGGKILLMARVEGNDRKSFFAIAESESGTEGFRFRKRPVIIPDGGETNVYDMRLTKHEDGYIYGVFCSERSAGSSDISEAVAAAGIVRTKDMENWERLPDLVTLNSTQQRNVCLHPEFVDGKYAFYTRPMDGFIEKMKRIVGSHANNPTNVKAKCKHSGCICYSAVMISDSALVLCLFEGRKQLLDQLYYDRMIRPIITHYKLPPNLIMLVSYSGFTGEEVSFANNNRIGLIDRTGFTSPYNNLMVNPDVFRLTRMRHGLNSRP